MINNTHTHASLFTGLGGFDYAAEQVGWTNVFQIEKDPYCLRLLAERYPNAKRYNNIIGCSPTERAKVLSGGFPCQDISNAKTHTTNGAFQVSGLDGKRSGLWWEYWRIIGEQQPYFAVIENVSDLTKKGLDIVLQSLSDIGYYAEWCVIPGAWVGSPHLRKRLWIVAYPVRFGRQQKSIILSRVLSQKMGEAPEWEFSRTVRKAYGKKALPPSLGIHDGLPRGLYDAERITALGNAIVWRIAYMIFKEINNFLNETT